MRFGMRFVLLCALLASVISVANAQWQCLYVTLDNEDNGTGDRTVGVGVIKENMFVALCTRMNTYCYMIPYVNADSIQGRKYTYGYGTSGIYEIWTDGAFDQDSVKNAFTIRATSDSLIYIANNDPLHNVLVFKYAKDTVTVVDPFPRQETGGNGIYGLDVDGSGYVYVCMDTTTGQTADLKVYSPVKQWTPAGHQDTPVSTINLPDGVYKGIAVSPDGKNIFIADYKNRKVIKYSGTRTTGYTSVAGFSFSVPAKDTITGTPPTRTGPIGLAYLASKNILAVACDSLLKPAGDAYYTYGRIYLLNGNTGALISTDTSMSVLDQVAWNRAIYAGDVSAQGSGIASGYASTMDVKWDEKGYLYTQSMYGWTVEKWKYNGTLPSFVTGVEQVGEAIPNRVHPCPELSESFQPHNDDRFCGAVIGACVAEGV
jgi:hypothetical protein